MFSVNLGPKDGRCVCRTTAHGPPHAVAKKLKQTVRKALIRNWASTAICPIAFLQIKSVNRRVFVRDVENQPAMLCCCLPLQQPSAPPRY